MGGWEKNGRSCTVLLVFVCGGGGRFQASHCGFLRVGLGPVEKRGGLAEQTVAVESMLREQGTEWGEWRGKCFGSGPIRVVSFFGDLPAEGCAG